MEGILHITQFASTTWEIYSYGGGEFLRQILNGVAAIFGNQNYSVALAISAMLGLLAVMVQIAFMKQSFNFQWLLGVIMFFQVALVPKVNVTVKDLVLPENTAVVANLPLGVGLTASFFSTFSHWSTTQSETVFSLPNQVSYQGSGLLFASRLVEESTRFELTDPRISSNFSDFWKSCVFYDLLLGQYTWGELVRSENLIDFLQANTSQTRGFTYTDVTNQRTIVICRAGINNQLAVDLNNETANATRLYAAKLLPEKSDIDKAVARYAAAMPVAYQYMTGLSLNNAQIIGTNVLANSLKRGLVSFASDANAPAAAQDFALARAEQERKTTFVVMGQIAKKMLPILQHLFESFIYAVSPIVLLMAMTPLVAKVAMGYVKALIWINLWPPLYAVLNFAVTFYSAAGAKAAVLTNGITGTTGLSLMTNTGLGHLMQDYAAVAGYLSLSIPMIAWMMVSMSGAMMAGLAGRLMQGYEQPVSKASDEAASGNINLGNSSFDNHSAFQHNASPTVDSGMVHERLGSGTMMDTSAAGRFMQFNQSSGGTSVDVGQTLVNSHQQSLDSAVQRQQQESAQLSESNQAVFRDAQAYVNDAGKSQTNDVSFKEAEKNLSTITQMKAERALDDWAQSQGIKLDDATKAQIAAQVEAGVSVPIFGGAKVSASAAAATSETESSSYDMAQRFMSSNEFTKLASNTAEASRDMVAKFGISTNEIASSSLDASLAEQKTNSRELSESIVQVESARESLSQAEQFATSFKQNSLNILSDYAQKEKGLSQADFENMIRNAGQGGLQGQQAREQIATLITESNLHQGGGINFETKANELSSAGEESIRNLFSNNDQAVSGANSAYLAAVQENTPISSDTVKDTLNHSVQGVQDGMNNPDLVRTQSDNVDRIYEGRQELRAEGEETQNRVQDMRVISDMAPGAAGVVGEQIREREIEELKQDSLDRFSERLKEKE
ncbi:conjugal transfer protein TraG N-terminal domain-containing protein [Algicola sagamiensis]|uniref:conjugal transfer protein TraG N-terminal domain-containing protein n=1 Tax=Algicola sagamiensis TaxID=163869 RepID=UPI00036BCA03|nr:conjugal transfer protein TraG N-terminal domain-containing protein [Algicola sagamiensis]